MTKAKRPRPKKNRLAKRFRGRNKFERALRQFRYGEGGSGNVDRDLAESPPRSPPRPRSPSTPSDSSSLSVPSPRPGPSRRKRVRRPVQDYDSDSPDSPDSPADVASLANAMSEASIGGEVGGICSACASAELELASPTKLCRCRQLACE